MKKAYKDIAAGVLLGAAALVYLAECRNIRIIALLGGSRLSAASIPRLWGILLCFLCIIVTVRGITGIISQRGKTEDVKIPVPEDEKRLRKQEQTALYISIAAFAGYVFLLERAGFILCSVCYMLFEVAVLSPAGTWKKHMRAGAMLSVIFPLIVYGLFVSVLNIPLPKGILGW